MTNETAVVKLARKMAEAEGPIDAMNPVDDFIETAELALAYIQSDLMAYVKPKPLEWVGDYPVAETTFGLYSIRDAHDDRFEWLFTSRGDWDSSDESYPTLEAAQAAAQDRHNKRVKELF